MIRIYIVRRIERIDPATVRLTLYPADGGTIYGTEHYIDIPAEQECKTGTEIPVTYTIPAA